MNKRIVILVFFGLLFNPFISLGQDSIPAPKDLSEEKELNFQQFFFKALSEKSITNYEKAIAHLQKCDEILPNSVSVLFEFSKNYLFLNKTFEAKEYILKALKQQPDNVWMLTHLVEVYKKERDFGKAVEIQRKVVKQQPRAREALVYLLLQNREYESTLALMNELEAEVGLSRNLKRLKKSLEKRKPTLVKKDDPTDLKGLVEHFKKEPSSFEILKKLLEKASKEDKAIFNTYSKEAISLFPAQPLAYLMRGKSLNYQKLYTQSLTILQSGIDFVIDNPKMEANFYEEMAVAYTGLKNTAKANELKNKAKKLRAIK
jgi:predicted Zn-dependent protease